MTAADSRVTRARERAAYGYAGDLTAGTATAIIRDLLDAYDELRADAAGHLLIDLAELGNQHAATMDDRDRHRAAADRARQIHAPIDAVHERTGEHHKLCAGCSTARDQWVKWPCRTINALDTRKANQ